MYIKNNLATNKRLFNSGYNSTLNGVEMYSTVGSSVLYKNLNVLKVRA